MRQNTLLLAVLSSASVCVVLTGCGPRAAVRHEVTGRVIFDGQPVEEGIIDFEPLDGQGSKDMAMIVNGDYRIPADKGLMPGRYRVAIVAGDGNTGKGDASPDYRQPKGPRGKERIPPEYNIKSNVVREITAKGPNTFDFDIPKPSK
jgi:hypothetical protein